MKHSKYVLAGLWDTPQSITSPSPIRWDVHGVPTQYENKPSFISFHEFEMTLNGEKSKGLMICCRKLGFDGDPETN